MKSLVVMTYYQLMHSIALALTFDEKPNLYFSMSYLNPDEKLLDRINESGVFNKVVGITRRGENRDFLIELRKTKGCTESEVKALGDSLFEQYLEPHYAELFKDANPKEEIYVYNDFQWHFYYISKHFSRIVGVEDGYASLQQQISIHRLKGDAELVLPFIEKGYYPITLYRHKNIEKIISSKSFEELDDYYKNKLEVWDFKDIVQLHRSAFRDALMYIFELEGFTVPENSSLILGQPLDRAKYCTPIENYFLNRIYVRNELKHCKHVYIKPHPAEKSDPRIYAEDGVEVLSGAFPVEILNYQDGRFSRVATFSSTGASMVTCTDKEIKYFNKTNTNREEVTAFIEELVSKEKIEIDMFERVREMSPERYIAVYSWIFRHDLMHTNIHIIIQQEEADVFKEYFSPKKMGERIEEYRRQKKRGRERDLWNIELLRLQRWYNRYSPKVDFCEVSAFDDWVVFEEVIRKYKKYDYMMLLDAYKPAFKEAKRLVSAFEGRMPSAVYFSAETEYINDRGIIRKVTVNPGYIETVFNGQLAGRMYHRELIRELFNGTADEYSFSKIINSYSETIVVRPAISIYIAPQTYPDAETGEEYYKTKTATVLDRYREEPDYMAAQLAHILYDYYIWRRVSGAVNTNFAEMGSIEEIIGDCETLFRAYRFLANGLLFQRARTDENRFFQESYFYRGIKAQIDKAADEGIFTKLDNYRRVKRKIKRVLRK